MKADRASQRTAGGIDHSRSRPAADLCSCPARRPLHNRQSSSREIRPGESVVITALHATYVVTLTFTSWNHICRGCRTITIKGIFARLVDKMRLIGRLPPLAQRRLRARQARDDGVHRRARPLDRARAGERGPDNRPARPAERPHHRRIPHPRAGRGVVANHV